MRFAVERKTLAAALDFAAKYAAKNEKTIPILATILLRADGEAITVAATNLDQYASESVAADISAPGAGCLPARELTAFVKSARGDVVALDVAADRASVACGRSRITLPIMAEDDFPTPFDVSKAGACAFVLSGADLGKTLRETEFAASSEEARYYLRGTSWRAVGGKIEVCATDGHKLALRKLPSPPDAESLPNVIIPNIALPKWAGDVAVSITDRFASFASDSQSVVTKLIDGSFPDYRRVIPQNNETKLLFDRAELLSAIGRAAVVGEDNNSGLLCVGRDGVATISGRTARGETVEEVRYEGNDFLVSFSGRVIAPVIESFDCEMIEVLYSTAMSPVIIQDPRDTERLCVAMPFRDCRLHDFDGDETREAAE